MKNITTKQFQILTDIHLVWDFMTDIYKPYFAMAWRCHTQPIKIMCKNAKRPKLISY